MFNLDGSHQYEHRHCPWPTWSDGVPTAAWPLWCPPATPRRWRQRTFAPLPCLAAVRPRRVAEPAPFYAGRGALS